MQYTQRARRRRLITLGCGVAVTALIVAGEAGSASAKPKPPAPVSSPGAAVAAPTGTVPNNPTDAELQAAVQNANTYANLVGVTNGRIAAIKIQISNLQGKVELAEQKVALTHGRAVTAEAAAQQAQKLASKVNAQAAAKRSAYVGYVQSTYYGGTLEGTTSAVLTAQDPSELLQASTLQSLAAQRKQSIVASYNAMTVYQSNVNAKAKLADKKAKKAEADAKQAVLDAQTAVSNAQTQQTNLETTLSQQQDTLTRAQAWKATEYDQRGKYVAYTTQLALHTAYEKKVAQYRQYQKDLAAYNKAVAEAKARAAAAAAAAAAKARARQHSGGGGGGSGSGSGGGGGGGGGPSAPSGGSWTPAKGRAAVARARAELGIIYAWAGGNKYGPTRGVCAGDGAWNDCHVIGFDCSGLALYAWGANWDHYAASQYYEAGSYHPSLDNLEPGDLLFWSNNSNESSIHHVAIYIGGGNIIQAPESGAYIEISSMWDPGTPFGATRPLT